MIRTISDALALAGGSRHRLFLLVGLLAAGVSILEAVSALLILVLMRLVLDPGQVPEVPIIGPLDRLFPAMAFQDLVLWFASAFGLFVILRAAAFLAQQYALGRVAENTGVILADRLFRGYLSAPYEDSLARNSSELIRNAYDNTKEVVDLVFAPLATLFAEGVLVIMMVAVLLIASPWATLVAALVMVATVLMSLSIVQPRIQRFGRRRQNAANDAIRHLQQGLGGLRDVKILGQEDQFASSFRSARSRMARAQYSFEAVAYVPRLAIEATFMFVLLAAIVFATFQDDVESVLATIGLFAYAGLRLQPSLQKIAAALNSLKYAEAPVEDLRADLDRFPKGPATSSRTLQAGSDELDGDIALEDVTFAYGGETGEPVLANISLRIQRGQSVGICGETGSGKSTLLDIICGLVRPTTGRVTVDGYSLAELGAAWQEQLGVVHQSAFLLDDSLARNITFLGGGSRVDLDRLKYALEVSQLDGFIRELPDGVDTLVGERGVRLSGGQRQRIALARAVYRGPSVLVMDEGTSALDNATETRVIDGLGQVASELTVIMVAHRLASLKHCDRIIVLEGGRIAAEGTYRSLMQESSVFRSMAAG